MLAVILYKTARIGFNVSYKVEMLSDWELLRYTFYLPTLEWEQHLLGSLSLSYARGGAVRLHTVHHSETNGIKTSCLIRQRPGDEPEFLSSCKLIFLLRQFVVCTVAVPLTWLQEPRAVCREREERAT